MNQKPTARRPPNNASSAPFRASTSLATAAAAPMTKKSAKDKEDSTTSGSSGGGGKGKGKGKGPKIEERNEEEGTGGGGGEGGEGEMWSEEEDEEAISMLEGIRQASESFHAKRSKKAAQQHEEFKKQIAEALSGVKKDIEEGWEEDEAAIDRAMAKLGPLLAPEAQCKADYARVHAARRTVWNKLGHCYEGDVDEAIVETKDEDKNHIAEIEGRPNEIKRARKKAIQLAQKEIALVHEEQTMITNGHDLIRNWALVLKPHPAHLGRSPSLSGRKGRAGVGYYVGAGGGTSALKRFQQKKMRGMGKGY